MKHKNLVGITALCCASMLLFACNNNKGGKPKGPTMYTVTFYSEGEVYATQEVEEHELATKPATDPTKAEHDFVGWFTAAEGGEEWVFTVNEVTQDTDLFAHFELGRVDFTINLIVGDQVATTLTTNSVDQTDVTLTGVNVGEGKSLLGYGRAAGTTAADVDYRVGAALPYADVVTMANSQHVVNLYAIAKVGDIIRLNVAQWERYADDACLERVVGAFKTYADDNSIAYDFLDITKFSSAANTDPYYSVDDLAPAVFADESLDVVFPTGGNFNTKYAAAATAAESDKTVLEHEALGVQIKNAKGTTASDASRYVSRLTNDAIAVSFVTWLLSDDGKLVLDPDYTPTPVAQTVLTISFFGLNISDTNAGKIVDEIKRYFTANSIEYTNVAKDYVNSETGTDNATYAAAISKSSNVSIGGGKASSLDTAFADNGFTVAHKKQLGTIAGATARYIHTFDLGTLTEACYTYLTSDAGLEFLATLTA